MAGRGQTSRKIPDQSKELWKLATQIVARTDLGTQLLFETLDDLWVKIIKRQQLTLC